MSIQLTPQNGVESAEKKMMTDTSGTQANKATSRRGLRLSRSNRERNQRRANKFILAWDKSLNLVRAYAKWAIDQGQISPLHHPVLSGEVGWKICTFLRVSGRVIPEDIEETLTRHAEFFKNFDTRELQRISRSHPNSSNPTRKRNVPNGTKKEKPRLERLKSDLAAAIIAAKEKMDTAAPSRKRNKHGNQYDIEIDQMPDLEANKIN